MTKAQRLVSVESTIFTPFSSALRSCDQDIQIEQSATEGVPATPCSWVDQCLETSLDLNADFQFETLLDNFQSEDVLESVDMKVEGAVTEVQHPRASSRSGAPASPDSSDSSNHQQQGGAIPRHKRPSHKRAELKRRDKIKTRLDEIKALVPSMADKGKMSEVAILSKAAEYKKHLLGECEKFSTEAGNLRREIESLSTEIHCLQEQLPAAGLKQETVEKSQSSMDKMYDSFSAASIKKNWKFFLFDFIAKPLFQTYKDVSTDTIDTFKESVEKWTKTTMGLANLRHQTFENMRAISRKTAVMTNPASLPEQALASIAACIDSSTAASAPSTLGVGQLFAPIVTLPPASATGQLSAPGIRVPSKTVVSASAPSGVAQLSNPMAGSPPSSCISHLPATVAQPSSGVSRLFAQVSLSPSSSGIAQHISAPPSSQQVELPFHAPATLGLSSVDRHLSTPVTSAPLSASVADLSASRQSVLPSAMPHLFSSLPSSPTQNPSLLSSNTMVTICQGLAPSELSSTCKVSASVKEEGHGQNRYLLPKPAPRAPSRKRMSDSNAHGLDSAVGELQPVQRKRESVEVTTVPRLPTAVGVFAPASQHASQELQVEAVPVDMSDICHLAASEEETVLNMHPPIAVVTPILTHRAPTTVARLVSGSQYHEYDFDIADIPLLEL